MRNTQGTAPKRGTTAIAAALLRGADAASVSGAVRYIARRAGAPVDLRAETRGDCCEMLKTRYDSWAIRRHCRTAKHIAGTVGARPSVLRAVAAAIDALALAAGVDLGMMVLPATGAGIVRLLREYLRCGARPVAVAEQETSMEAPAVEDDAAPYGLVAAEDVDTAVPVSQGPSVVATIAAAVGSLVQGARAAVGRVAGFVRGLFGRRGAPGASS